MNRACADLKLDLNAKALAVGQLLAARPPDFAAYDGGRYDVRIWTRPWYNGRERGLCFVMQPCLIGAKAVFLAVFEDRLTDDIVVEEWPSHYVPFQHVTAESRDDTTDRPRPPVSRKPFPASAVGRVADHVYRRMEKHYKAQLRQRGDGR